MSCGNQGQICYERKPSWIEPNFDEVRHWMTLVSDPVNKSVQVCPEDDRKLSPFSWSEGLWKELVRKTVGLGSSFLYRVPHFFFQRSFGSYRFRWHEVTSLRLGRWSSCCKSGQYGPWSNLHHNLQPFALYYIQSLNASFCYGHLSIYMPSYIFASLYILMRLQRKYNHSIISTQYGVSSSLRTWNQENHSDRCYDAKRLTPCKH